MAKKKPIESPRRKLEMISRSEISATSATLSDELIVNIVCGKVKGKYNS